MAARRTETARDAEVAKKGEIPAYLRHTETGRDRLSKLIIRWSQVRILSGPIRETLLTQDFFLWRCHFRRHQNLPAAPRVGLDGGRRLRLCPHDGSRRYSEKEETMRVQIATVFVAALSALLLGVGGERSREDHEGDDERRHAYLDPCRNRRSTICSA